MLNGPVSFKWSSAVLAGAIFLPLDGWQQEFPESDVMVELLSRATAVGMVETLSSGTDTLLEESPVQAGGVAGTIPSRLNTEPLISRSKAGKRLKHKYRNPTGGTITVDGIVTITPLRGGKK